MPRITVHAVDAAGQPRRWTLSERIVAENLDSDHYVNQLIERLAWATADAKAQESRADSRQSADMHPQSSLAAARIRRRAPSARSITRRRFRGRRSVRLGCATTGRSAFRGPGRRAAPR
jgi:hypothetical protein